MEVAATSGGTAAQVAPLLPGLYQAATEPDRWPEVLADIVRLLGGHQGQIFSHQATPEQHGMWVPHRLDPQGMREYVERFHAEDIWMQRGHALGVFYPGNVVTSDDLLPREEFLASVFYREFLSRYDIHDLCAGMLHDGREPDVPIVHLAIYRPLGAPRFGAAEKALMAALTPHLREATRIGFRLGALGRRLAVLERAVETIGPALVLLDGQDRVVFANTPAQGMIEQGDGLRLVERQLRVAPSLQGRLGALLAPDAREDEALLRVPRPSGRPDLWIVRVPLPRPAEADAPPDARRPVTAVMIHDLASAQEIDFESFARAHGLTRAERRLLGALVEHPTLAPMAAALGVSVNTVRSQLRAILEKTGTRRQTELVRLLMGWPRKLRQPKASGSP